MEFEAVILPPADEVHARLDELVKKHGEQGMNSPLGDYIASLESECVGDWADPSGQGFAYKFECSGGDEVRLDVRLIHRSYIDKNWVGWQLSYQLDLFRRDKHEDTQLIIDRMVPIDADERDNPGAWEA